ncbi:MAG: response regulator transcription factor [Myxococcaceae bacterium]|nr:response regulator transcription factor [Myxococcaceae bacterium]
MTTPILLVDDHVVVRAGLAALLRSAITDVELGEAGDISEALRAIEARDWALIVLDINLPGRSGLELLQGLSTSHPRLPVLVMSGYPERGFAARSLRLGARGYVTKSTAADELVAAVHQVLAGRRYVSRALAEHLAEDVVHEDVDPLTRLSHRELEVLRHVAQGRSLKAIAAELNLSEKTIGTYRARLGEKLGLHSNVELTRFAVQHHLIDGS